MAEFRLPLVALVALLALAPGPARAQGLAPVPPAQPNVAVVDLTGTLTPDQVAALEQKIDALEQRKGAELAVLMVPTTQPEDVAQYGIRVAEAWGVGRGESDDGAILLVAKDDRRMRIEVGYGLEGAIPDAVANRILDEYMRPAFRAGDYYAGIDQALDRMIRLIDGETLPPPKAREWQPQPGGLELVFPVLLIAFLVAGPILRRVLGRPLGSLATGGVAGFLAWTLVGVLGIAIFAAILAFVFTLLGGLGGSRWASGGRGRRGGWGGYSGGGWGGGGFGGGGGGFGGGGFGGGGFGGGGASGGW